jgi:hypothetical protein
MARATWTEDYGTLISYWESLQTPECIYHLQHTGIELLRTEIQRNAEYQTACIALLGVLEYVNWNPSSKTIIKIQVFVHLFSP